MTTDNDLLVLAADLERELSFVLNALEPKEHRDAWTKTRTCPWVTPDCLWCNIRRVLTRSEPITERLAPEHRLTATGAEITSSSSHSEDGPEGNEGRPAPVPASSLPSMDDYPDAVPGGPVTHPASERLVGLSTSEDGLDWETLKSGEAWTGSNQDDVPASRQD